MKKAAITTIFTLIAAVLIIIFSLSLVRLFNIEHSDDKIVSDYSKSLDGEEKGKREKTWYELLAGEKIPDFMPMSNELYIHFELASSGYSRKKKFFKLSINKNDAYSLFCVKQTVSRLDLRYFFVNTKKDAKIIIDTMDVSLLHQLVETLKGYKIGSSFEEIWI